MRECLQHLELIVDHLLVALYTLLEDDLDCHLVSTDVGFPYDAVGACSQCLSEAILGLFVIAIGLALQLVHHATDCSPKGQQQVSASLEPS